MCSVYDVKKKVWEIRGWALQDVKMDIEDVNTKYSFSLQSNCYYKGYYTPAIHNNSKHYEN